MICLFLILSIGISHGALDNQKGKRDFTLLVDELQQIVCVFVVDVLDALLAKAAVTLSFRLNVNGVQVANFLICHNGRD